MILSRLFQVLDRRPEDRNVIRMIGQNVQTSKQAETQTLSLHSAHTNCFPGKCLGFVCGCMVLVIKVLGEGAQNVLAATGQSDIFQHGSTSARG